MESHDIIIVGGGIAGLTAAAYASRDGFDVLVCETQGKVGGLANSFERNGFVFDQGIRSIENSGIVFPMLGQLGIDLPFIHSAVSLGIAHRMIRIDNPGSVDAYARMLQDLFPSETSQIDAIITEIKTIMSYMDTIYGIDNPLFLDSFRDLGYVMKTLLPWMVRYLRAMPKIAKLGEPVDEYLRKFTDNQALIDLIAQHFFAKTPTSFALSYFSLYLDYQYPKGGTGSFASALADFVTGHGGTILTDTAITGVDVDRRCVTDAHGTVHGYRQMIWCADMKMLYRLTHQTAKEGSQIHRTAQDWEARLHDMHGGDSIFTTYLSVDLPPSYFSSIASAHVFHTPLAAGLSQVPPPPTDRSEESMKHWIHRYLTYTTYEISLPVLRDSSLAPEGKTGVIVSTLFDYGVTRSIREAGWYEAFKRFASETMIEVLDSSLYPGLAGKVIDVFSATPLTIERFTGNTEGAITGWAFTNDFMPAVHEMRKIMKAVHTPLPDVWQAGQWSFSPSGLPISVLTGRLASQQAAKRLRKHG